MPLRPHSRAPWYAAPFQRVTSRGEHVREIDGLRFLALSAVLLLHLNHQVGGKLQTLFGDFQGSILNTILEEGTFGVQLFFAISGFILALPFARHFLHGEHPVKLKAYYLRRFTRLEPPLLINLTLLFGVLVFVLDKPMTHLWTHFLATCTYLHTTLFGQPSPINPVTWSLEVEVKFYLTMPLWARLFSIRPFALRQAVFISLLIACALQPWVRSTGSLLPQLPYFLLGFMLADLWLSRWNSAKSALWDLSALAAWLLLLAALLWKHSIPGYNAVLPLLLLVALIASLKGAIFSAFLSHWLPVTVGGMCYTIYLFHLQIFSALTSLSAKWITTPHYELNFALHTLIVLPITLTLCSAFFVLIERPFMKWRPGANKRHVSPIPPIQNEASIP